MTIAPWSGRKVTEARTYMATRLPAPCGQCGKPVTTRDTWVIGHVKSRLAYPELTWDTSNWRHEHASCSDRSSSGAHAEKALRDAGVFSPDLTPSGALTKGFGTPTLTARAGWELDGTNNARNREVKVTLTAEQVSALERGRAIRMDLDAYHAAGGRKKAS